MANIIPGSPIAFEGMPADGLLSGIVCLSPALAGSLRDAGVAHVVVTWKMKACISRGIGYYTVFPSQGPAVFWLSLQKTVKPTLWAQTLLTKEHEIGWKGGGHKFSRNDRTQVQFS